MLRLVLLFTALFVLVVQLPLYTDPYIINDDLMVHTFSYSYMHDDILREASMSWNPFGYDLIFRTLMLFIDPLYIGYVITMIVTILTILFAYLYGCEIRGERFGGILAILSLFMIWQMPLLSGGHPRSFAFLFLFSYLYYVSRQSYLGTLLSLVLSLLIYPVVFLIIIIHFIYIYRKRVRKLFVGGIIMLPLLLFLYTFKDPGALGDTVGLSMVVTHPVFSSGGYYQLYPFLDPVRILFQYVPVLLALVVVLSFLIPYRKIPKDIRILSMSGIFIYVVALFTGMELYDYRRYIFYTLPLLLTFGLAFVVYRLFIRSRWQGLTLLFVSCCVLAFGIDLDYFDCSPVKPLQDVFGSEADAIVAGHPFDMSCLVLFTEAQILYSDEMFSPMYQDYFSIIDARIRDYFLAASSVSKDAVEAFCKKYNVTHIVVDPNRLSDNFVDDADHKMYYATMSVPNQSSYLFKDKNTTYIYRCGE